MQQKVMCDTLWNTRKIRAKFQPHWYNIRAKLE